MLFPPTCLFVFFFLFLHSSFRLLNEQDRSLPTRMGPSFLSRPPASRLHKRREFHVAPQPLEPTFAERTARRNCACFRGGGRGFIEVRRWFDIGKIGTRDRGLGIQEIRSIDRFSFSKSWKNNFEERIRKPTNFIISFLVCLFVGKPVLDNVFLHSNPRLRRESNKFFPN